MTTMTGEHALPGAAWPRGPAVVGRAVIEVMMLFAAFVAAGAFANGYTDARMAGDGNMDSASGVYTSFHTRQSHAGHFRGAVVTGPSLIPEAEQRLVVRLTTRSGRRVTHAHLHAVVTRPDDNAFTHDKPAVQYVGKGLYEISGLRFDRAGWWNVALSVSYRGRTDSLAFNLIVP